MNTYICFLRGINVSGQKKVTMAELRSLCEQIGFESVQSYIQSGNLIFQSEMTAGECCRLIEKTLSDRLGWTASALMLTREQLSELYKNTPFAQDRIFYTFLIQPTEETTSNSSGADVANQEPAISSETLRELQTVLRPEDEIAAGNGVIYFNCPGSYGETKLSNNFIEKKLKVSATTRNRRTVEKMLAMAGS